MDQLERETPPDKRKVPPGTKSRSWLWTLLPVLLGVPPVLLALLFLWAVYVHRAERRRRIAEAEARGEKWCERCVDINPLNIETLERVSDDGFGSTWKCPLCGRVYYFNHIAHGGGRITEVKQDPA